MQIETQNNNLVKVDKVSELIGIKKQDLVEMALLLYLDNSSKYLELKQEIKEWDFISDEALINFEKLLINKYYGKR